MVLTLYAGDARAETLPDVVAMAYQNNPTLLAQRAQLRALDETYVQSLAGYRPQISTSVEGDYVNGPSTTDAAVRHASASVIASQPIYTGGLVSAEVRAAKADVLSGREKLRQIEADFLQSVIQAYADVRRDRQGLSIADQNLSALSRQLDETRARFDAGDLTRTDVALAEARLAAAQAQRSSAQAQLSVSQANYEALVGQPPGDLAPEPPLAGLPASVDEAFDAADQNSPLIIGADYAEQATAARVTAAKAAERPTLAVKAELDYGGYYPPSLLVGSGLRAVDRNISASVTLTQPLYMGGANASHIRQALDNDSSQLISIEGARRQAVQSVSHAWAELLAARANVTSETDQVSADQVAFEGTHEEQQVGLRTTIDVLNAEQELQNAQLALVVAHHDEYVAGASLLNAMGRLGVDAVAPGTSPYDPKVSFDRVRRRGAVPWEGLVAGVDSIGAPPIKAHAPIQAGPPAEGSVAGAQVLH